MRIIDAAIPGVKIIEPDVFGDYRGYFMETWSEPKYAALNFVPCQDNESFTAKKGTLRGLHFQMDPMSQAKIVRVIHGAVMDVAVDLRRGSPTYLKWVTTELSGENHRQYECRTARQKRRPQPLAELRVQTCHDGLGAAHHDTQNKTNHYL